VKLQIFEKTKKMKINYDFIVMMFDSIDTINFTFALQSLSQFFRFFDQHCKLLVM